MRLHHEPRSQALLERKYVSPGVPERGTLGTRPITSYHILDNFPMSQTPPTREGLVISPADSSGFIICGETPPITKQKTQIICSATPEILDYFSTMDDTVPLNSKLRIFFNEAQGITWMSPNPLLGDETSQRATVFFKDLI